MADVNDLWPEAMRMVLDIPVVSDILFYPLKRDAEKVYSLVSGVIGTSDEYQGPPVSETGDRPIPRETVYVGNELREFDEGAQKNRGGDTRNPKASSGCPTQGTIGTSYDIRTMVLAAEELMKRGRTDIRVQDPGRRAHERRTGRTCFLKKHFQC